MITDDIKADIEKATVVLPEKDVLGVLVSGRMILTASHCLNFDYEKRACPAYECDYGIETVKTAEGKLLQVQLLAFEPIIDIAVLGSYERRSWAIETSELLKDFWGFYTSTKPVSVCRSDLEIGEKFPIYVYTCEGRWIRGSATPHFRRESLLSFQCDEPIMPGTSGGPIVNESGELVGIYSQSSTILESDESNKDCPVVSGEDGIAPRPHLALPVWVCREIFGPAEKEE